MYLSLSSLIPFTEIYKDLPSCYIKVINRHAGQLTNSNRCVKR